MPNFDANFLANGLALVVIIVATAILLLAVANLPRKGR